MKRILLPLIYWATVALVALAWTSLAFCGEIHDAAKRADLEKVKVLLKSNPNLVLAKTPRQDASSLGDEGWPQQGRSGIAAGQQSRR